MRDGVSPDQQTLWVGNAGRCLRTAGVESTPALPLARVRGAVDMARNVYSSRRTI